LCKGAWKEREDWKYEKNSNVNSYSEPPERLRSNMAKIYEIISKKVTKIWKKKKREERNSENKKDQHNTMQSKPFVQAKQGDIAMIV